MGLGGKEVKENVVQSRGARAWELRMLGRWERPPRWKHLALRSHGAGSVSKMEASGRRGTCRFLLSHVVGCGQRLQKLLSGNPKVKIKGKEGAWDSGNGVNPTQA